MPLRKTKTNKNDFTTFHENTMEHKLLLFNNYKLLDQLFKIYFERNELSWEVILATIYTSVLEKIKERNFNLAIIAIEICDLQQTGFDIADVIRILHPNTKIILVSESPFENNLEIFTKRGYHGFLLYSDELQEFTTSIKNVMLGGNYISPTVAGYLKNYQNKSLNIENFKRHHKLSPRELEIINHICNGCTNKEIAFKTGTECSTIKKHIQNICSKLNLRSRLEISNYAIRNRIIGINPSS